MKIFSSLNGIASRLQKRFKPGKLESSEDRSLSKQQAVLKDFVENTKKISQALNTKAKENRVLGLARPSSPRQRLKGQLNLPMFFEANSLLEDMQAVNLDEVHPELSRLIPQEMHRVARAVMRLFAYIDENLKNDMVSISKIPLENFETLLSLVVDERERVLRQAFKEVQPNRVMSLALCIGLMAGSTLSEAKASVIINNVRDVLLQSDNQFGKSWDRYRHFALATELNSSEAYKIPLDYDEMALQLMHYVQSSARGCLSILILAHAEELMRNEDHSGTANGIENAQAIAENKIKLLHLESWCNFDVISFAKGNNLVELIQKTDK